MGLQEYTLRMNRVLDHIDRHLGESLELDTLADVAHFSRYHFHRVFAAWVGETFGEYLRRRRLEIAALKLVGRPELGVLEVALSVGFGSGEAFARAFKSRFGRTPTAWREDALMRAAADGEAARRRRLENGNPDQANRNIDQVTPIRRPHNDSSSTIKEPDMQVDIIDMPSVKVAYMRNIGPYGPQIGEFWRNAVMPWLVSNNLNGRPTYGIGHDDPCITAPDKCRYDACVEVADDFTAQGRVNVTTLPGGRYAVTKFSGSPATIGNAWTEFFADWLPKSGFQCDDRPYFEYYPASGKYNQETGVFNCDLCIPIRAL